MSPGPSLAVIGSVTLNQGRLAGMVSALAHGLAIAGFALLTALGLVVVMSGYALAFNFLQVAGCVYLLWMALKLLFAAPRPGSEMLKLAVDSNWAAARDGFLVALVNPKIIIFFTALFSQFITADTELWAKLVMAAIAGSLDMLWYMLVAVVISRPGMLIRYQSSSAWLNKVFGLVLLVIVAGIVADFVA
jgi:threonine/homoserine/homoserine lactone efflux protein